MSDARMPWDQWLARYRQIAERVGIHVADDDTLRESYDDGLTPGDAVGEEWSCYHD